MARVLRRRSVHRSRLRARTKKSWRDCACRTTYSSGSSIVSSASDNDGPFQNGNDLFLVHCWATKPLTYQLSSAPFSSPNDALEAAITDVCVMLPSKEETLCWLGFVCGAGTTERKPLPSLIASRQGPAFRLPITEPRRARLGTQARAHTRQPVRG